MTDLERRALLGDRQAQLKCTRNRIVLRCPFCGNIPITEDNRVFCGVCGLSYEELDAGLSLHAWNTRPAPPIGRCEECDLWYEEKGICTAGSDDDLGIYEYTEPDHFCGYFKQKGGEENG